MALQTRSTLLTLVASAEIGFDASGELNMVHLPNCRWAAMKIRSARSRRLF
jgi:hypothetical protein